MALILKRQTVKVAHLNVREEKHGEEPVLAVDIKLTADMRNDFLDQLGEGLRVALYRPDEEQLAGVEVPMSILRFPVLKPLGWDVLMPNVVLTLHGAKKADDQTFEGKISKAIALDPKEGGTVEVSFQVQVNPTPEQMGPLSALLGHSTKVSVRPGEAPAEETDPLDPDAAAQDEAENQMTAPAGKAKKDGPKKK